MCVPSAKPLACILAIVLLPTRVDADWTLAAFLGKAATRPSNVTIDQSGRQTQLEIGRVTYRDESFEPPWYYIYRIGWIPNSHAWIGVEAELVHTKVIADTRRAVPIRGTLRGASVDGTVPLSSLFQRLEMSHGLNFVFANVVFRRDLRPDPRGGRRLGVVLRVGAGPTLPHAESASDGIEREQYESGGLGSQVGGGLELPVWRGFDLLGEYKFSWTTSHIDIVGGTATIPARTHHVAGGLGYRF